MIFGWDSTEGRQLDSALGIKVSLFHSLAWTITDVSVVNLVMCNHCLI